MPRGSHGSYDNASLDETSDGLRFRARGVIDHLHKRAEPLGVQSISGHGIAEPKLTMGTGLYSHGHLSPRRYTVIGIRAQRWSGLSLKFTRPCSFHGWSKLYDIPLAPLPLETVNERGNGLMLLINWIKKNLDGLLMPTKLTDLALRPVWFNKVWDHTKKCFYPTEVKVPELGRQNSREDFSGGGGHRCGCR